MKNLVFTFLAILTIGIGHAQEKAIDSLGQQVTDGLKEKFPETRFLNFEYGQSFSRDFSSEHRKVSINKGKIKSQQTFRAFLNTPVYTTKQWNLVMSGSYEHNQIEFENSSNPSIFEVDGTSEYHKFSTSFDATYVSSLFKKLIIYKASITVDASDKYFGRVRGTLGFSFILKNTNRTAIALGAIGFIDPSAPLPVFPVFAYNHKFKDSRWDLDLILPQRLLIRRLIGDHGRLSFGTSLGNTAFYTKINNASYHDVFEYNQIELKTGMIYEHRINSYLIGTIQGGFQNFIGNRLTEKGKSNKDYIYENKQDGTGYFQIGISIDPFAKNK
jgi:hypothetical protein